MQELWDRPLFQLRVWCSVISILAWWDWPVQASISSWWGNLSWPDPKGGVGSQTVWGKAIQQCQSILQLLESISKKAVVSWQDHLKTQEAQMVFWQQAPHCEAKGQSAFHQSSTSHQNSAP